MVCFNVAQYAIGFMEPQNGVHHFLAGLECSQIILGHVSSLEVDSDQSKACLDDQRGFVDVGMGWDS